MRALAAALAGLYLTFGSSIGAAQEAFYKGKTIRIVISTGVAGGYAEYARVLAAHMGRYIAGNPSFVVESMPGAGGLLATNYLYTTAPKDGTTMGIVHSSVPLMPLWGSKGARFEPLKFNWLGAFDQVDGMCIAWRDSPVKTWDDLLKLEFTVGSSGAGSEMEIYPAMLNRLFGTKFKIISGYKDGTDVFLAMERGEVEGRCGGLLTVIKATRPEWLKGNKIVAPIVISEKRSKDFPDTPTILEFVKDDATRKQLDLVMLSQTLDRPTMMPPGVPEARLAEIRKAFEATFSDPEFLRDIEKKNLHVAPTFGPDMVKKLAGAYALPADIVEGAKRIMGEH